MDFVLRLVEAIIRAYRREGADGLVLRVQRKLVVQWRRRMSPRRNDVLILAGSRRRLNSAQTCEVNLFRKNEVQIVANNVKSAGSTETGRASARSTQALLSTGSGTCRNFVKSRMNRQVQKEVR